MSELLPLHGGWPFDCPINCPFTINEDSPQEKGLVAWWPLGSGQWGMLRDVRGHWHMTAYNTPKLAGSKRGRCTLFDSGSSQYLEIALAVVIGPPVTFSAWVCPEDDANLQYIVSIADVDKHNDYFGIAANGSAAGDPFTIVHRDQANNTLSASTTTGYSLNRWSHCCGVYAALDDRRIFKDAGSKGTNTDTASTVSGQDTTSIARIGDKSPSDYFDGRMLDVRIYDRALSDAEVKILYKKPWDLYRPLVPYPLIKAPTGGTTYYSTPTGVLTPAGTMRRLSQVTRVGVLTPAGAISRETQTSEAGSLAPSGGLTRETQTTKAGSLGLAGALDTIRIFLQSVAGALGLAGGISRQTGKGTAGALSPAGAVSRETQTTKAGSLGLAGALDTIRIFLQSVAGALGLAGGISRQTGKGTAGALSPAGAITRLAAKAVTGALGLAGNISRQTAKGTAGALSPAGAITRLVGKAVAGALGLAGSLAEELASRIVSPGPVLRAAIDGLRAVAGVEGKPDARAAEELDLEIRGGEEL